MKKRFILAAICVFASSILASCADVPSEVQKEISLLDKQEENPAAESDWLPKYQTLSEIRSSIDSTIIENTRIVQVIGTPVIPDGDTLPLYQISPVVLSEQEVMTVFSDAINALQNKDLDEQSKSATWYDSSAPISSINISNDDNQEQVVDVTNQGWTIYADGFRAGGLDQSYSLAVTTHGAVSNYWQDTEPPIYYTSLPIEDIFPVGYDENGLYAKYPMLNGEEWSIADAVSFAEEFYNTAFSDLPQKMTFCVKEVIVRKLPNGGYGYDFSLQQIVSDGIPILPLSILNYSVKNDTPDSILFGKVCSMWCVTPEVVQEYSMQGCYRLTDVSEQKLLSADSALQIVSDSIAQKQTLSVYMELGLVYRVNGSEYIKLSGDSTAYDNALQNFDYTAAEAVPYWLLWLPNEGFKPRMSGTYFMVNALTGELEIR